MTNKIEISTVLIENRIFTIRGEQVMIDTDLAEIYQVETKVLNQAVKRNIDRFPASFRFQLNEQEFEFSQTQKLDPKFLRSQSVTLETGRGKHRKYLPFAFTEQGVAMLSAVLRSDTAIKVSVAIMNAFVQMRKTIGNHQQLLQLTDSFTQHKFETNHKFEQIFKALEVTGIDNKQGIFFDGQTYDAYSFVNSLIKKAKHSIILIDNYIDESVITQLTKKQKNVNVFVLCKSISKQLKLDIERANTQYPSFKVVHFAKAHDRFLIIDEEDVFHIGASLKDLGKKWFAFSRIERDSVKILDSIVDLL
ncbi:MAG: ORF6N domain-containing protein [Candidatus Kapaibacterium sp.]